ncbi:hypothetical protein SERLADRAFT_440125 [Serpula lacrymans var. lacrymans S7.9]|uniref:Uncharacterized protein n=1 Tax=Serpula lacrymans var. lacrymans (strain S7.9) TaxID=578457 RepID=F8P3K2_SERL9|nr:uncharacterized protein SERLADRAFT_440125 [Serpula lacrymans var. lacrymans S7.9]EGO22101.1 hypothetical protein SERLADRAFT_440125 [Serpula lacrymans var. lacrymans S7.9]
MDFVESTIVSVKRMRLRHQAPNINVANTQERGPWNTHATFEVDWKRPANSKLELELDSTAMRGGHSDIPTAKHAATQPLLFHDAQLTDSIDDGNVSESRMPA